MNQYVESMAQLIGTELQYDDQKTSEIRQSLQVISTTLMSGALFSTSVYLWYQSLSLFSIIGGSISVYLLYCQLCSLYCQVRLIQEPLGHIHTYEHEFSLFKATLLTGAYNGSCALVCRLKTATIAPSTPPISPLVKQVIKVKRKGFFN